MAIIIQKNQKFFDEVSKFNPKLARLLEHEHGWTDKLVYRSDNGSIPQPRRRQERTDAIGEDDPIKNLVPDKMGRN